MAAFFKVKDPDSARWALYLFATTLAWFFVSVRRASPANSGTMLSQFAHIHSLTVLSDSVGFLELLSKLTRRFAEIVFGDENIEILDVPGTPTSAEVSGNHGDLHRTTTVTTGHKEMVTRRKLAQAYAQPLDRSAINQFI